MTKVQEYSARGANVNSAVTTYFSLGVVRVSSSATEANPQRTTNTAGVISNLWQQISSNTLAVNPSLTVFTRKSGVDQNETLVWTSTQTGVQEDTTHTDTVTVGDLWCSRFTAGTDAGHTSLTNIYGTIFNATVNTVAYHGLQGNVNEANASTTEYQRYEGGGGLSATEATSYKFKTKVVGTCKNMNVMIPTNARTNNTDYRSRVNGAFGNMIVTYGNVATGQKSDTSNTDVLAVNDLVNRSITTSTGTNTITYSYWGSDFLTTNNTGMHMIGMAGQAYSSNTTIYESVIGGTDTDTVEANKASKTGVAQTLSNMEAYLSADTLVTASSLNFRKNSGNGNQTVAIPGLSAAGWYEDTTHSDALVTTDLIDTQILAGLSVGNSLTLTYIAYKFQIRQANPVGSFFPLIL